MTITVCFFIILQKKIAEKFVYIFFLKNLFENGKFAFFFVCIYTGKLCAPGLFLVSSERSGHAGSRRSSGAPSDNAWICHALDGPPKVHRAN